MTVASSASDSVSVAMVLTYGWVQLRTQRLLRTSAITVYSLYCFLLPVKMTLKQTVGRKGISPNKNLEPKATPQATPLVLPGDRCAGHCSPLA